jgi:hypothetical protein
MAGFTPFASARMTGDDDEEAPARVGLLGDMGGGGGLGGLLGGMGSKISDNSNLMSMLGLALMSGRSNNPFENTMQAMSVGGTMDARAQKARAEQIEKLAKQKAYREWAEKNGQDPNLLSADPELGRSIIADRSKQPSFQERLYNGLPGEQKSEATNALLGITKNSGYEPILQKTADGDRTVGYREKGTGRVISVSAMNQMAGFDAQPQGDVIPGVDMDELKKKRAQNIATEEKSVGERARTAATMMPHVDRATEAYKGLATAGAFGGSAIGPLASSGFNRTIESMTGQRPEKLRQEYEAAAKELELAKAQISLKGQGQVTESERRLLALTLPRLDAADPQTGLRTLQNMKQLLTQYEREKAGQGQARSGGNPNAENPWQDMGGNVRWREKR